MQIEQILGLKLSRSLIQPYHLTRYMAFHIFQSQFSYI